MPLHTLSRKKLSFHVLPPRNNADCNSYLAPKNWAIKNRHSYTAESISLRKDKVTATNSSFLRELFLQRLPANFRMVLTSKDLETLAQLADKIVEVAAPTVHSVEITTDSHSQELQQLWANLSDLKRIVESIHRSSCNRSPHPGSTRNHRSCNSTPEPLTEPDVCWYHHRFGEAACKCQAPCSKLTGENARASN